MKLTPEGQKVWDAPYHPPAPYRFHPIGKEYTEWRFKNGVPFGWVVAKDVLAADGRVNHFRDGADLAVKKAIALCNALAEVEGD